LLNCEFSHESVKKIAVSSVNNKIMKKRHSLDAQIAKPSKTVPNFALPSSPATRESTSKSTFLYSQQFSIPTPAQQSPRRGPVQTTQAERAEREKQEEPERRERNRTWTDGRAGVRHPPGLSETSSPLTERNSAVEPRAAPRAGHPMPSSADLRAQRHRGSR